MDYKTFLKELRKLRKNGWKLENRVAIRCAVGDCPLVAVARAKYPRKVRAISHTSGYKAWDILKFKDSEVFDPYLIIDAADIGVRDLSGGTATLKRRIRRELREAVGL